eukprot:UN24062
MWQAPEDRKTFRSEDVEMKYEQYINLMVQSTIHRKLESTKKLLIKQKNSWQAELTQLAKNKRAAKNSLNYLPVYRAAVCAICSVLPDPTLTDWSGNEDVFIGKILLHPDFELAQYASLTLQKMMKTHYILFNQVLNALREYVTSFSIHKSASIATLLRQMGVLVDIWADTVDCRSERYESHQVLESILE